MMNEALSIKDDMVTGEVAIDLAPGTVAAACDRAVSVALSEQLTDAATRLGVVLAAPANKYARPLPGKDDQGRTRYAVRGRAEGGRLVPDHSGGPNPKHRRNG